MFPNAEIISNMKESQNEVPWSWTPPGDLCPPYPRMILADHNIVLWQVLFTTWQDLSLCTFSKYKISVFAITVKYGMSFRLCQLQYSLWNKSCGQPALSGQCFQTSLWSCWTPWCLLAGTPTKTCQILWRGSWKENYESFKCCDALNIDIKCQWGEYKVDLHQTNDLKLLEPGEGW